MVALIVLPMGWAIGTAAGYFGGVIDVIFDALHHVFLAFPRWWLALASRRGAWSRHRERGWIADRTHGLAALRATARAETLAIRNADTSLPRNCRALRHSASSLAISFRFACHRSSSGSHWICSGIINHRGEPGFLGLGAQPPLPEWGAMIATGRQFLLDQWWVATIPGIAIFSSASALIFRRWPARCVDPRL